MENPLMHYKSQLLGLILVLLDAQINYDSCQALLCYICIVIFTFIIWFSKLRDLPSLFAYLY